MFTFFLTWFFTVQTWGVLRTSKKWSMCCSNGDPNGKYSKLVGGFNPSEKYEFVSWDYYSQLNGQIKHVPNHQPAKDGEYGMFNQEFGRPGGITSPGVLSAWDWAALENRSIIGGMFHDVCRRRWDDQTDLTKSCWFSKTTSQKDRNVFQLFIVLKWEWLQFQEGKMMEHDTVGCCWGYPICTQTHVSHCQNLSICHIQLVYFLFYYWFFSFAASFAKLWLSACSLSGIHLWHAFEIHFRKAFAEIGKFTRFCVSCSVL